MLSRLSGSVAHVHAGVIARHFTCVLEGMRRPGHSPV